MLFPTVEFALFFLMVFAISWSLHARDTARKVFLLLASYFFYAYWDYRFAFLLAECSLMNYVFGLIIVQVSSDRAKKAALYLGVLANLAVLGFFKYFDFFTVSFNQAALGLGMPASLPVLEIILPIGVSFFTFQGISYLIDIYREDIPAEESALDVLLYLSFFPQLVAGPIVRASTFLPQLRQGVNPNTIEAGRCVMLIATGLFKKIVIASYLATDLVQPVFENPKLFSSLDALMGLYGYAIQIYCDFSAYSDIAIGVAGLLGYRFLENFNQPYRAASIQEFWRRWHISLSTWLKDYLYYPLGGSRGGEMRTCRNLFIVMVVAGFWHGAAWTFVIFGVLHGACIVLERFLFRSLPVLVKSKFYHAIGILLTFHFVCFTLTFFAADTLDISYDYLSTLFAGNFATHQTSLLSVLLIGLGLALNFLPKTLGESVCEAFVSRPLVVQAVSIGVFFVLLGALSPDGVAPFIYYRF